MPLPQSCGASFINHRESLPLPYSSDYEYDLLGCEAMQIGRSH
jgi:hypothetical protein